MRTFRRTLWIRGRSEAPCFCNELLYNTSPGSALDRIPMHVAYAMLSHRWRPWLALLHPLSCSPTVHRSVEIDDQAQSSAKLQWDALERQAPGCRGEHAFKTSAHRPTLPVAAHRSYTSNTLTFVNSEYHPMIPGARISSLYPRWIDVFAASSAYLVTSAEPALRHHAWRCSRIRKCEACRRPELS